jgi:multidrug efflux pump subunit AcrA (membrane-fusion protein)
MNHVEIRDRRHDPAVDRKTGEPPKERARARHGWARFLFALGPFLVLALGLAYGALHYYSQRREVMADAEQIHNFLPSVRVATVQPSPGNVVVTLPGTTAAFADANIYARATGYIEKRNVDIGDHVKAGDLLAQLAVPELDHQISQNEATLIQYKAALQQAEANRELAQVTWNRDAPLVVKGWVSQQQGTIDVQTLRAREAALGVAQANVAAQDNLLRVLRQDRDYASVIAPFDGVITERNVDVGSLVTRQAALSCSQSCKAT